MRVAVRPPGGQPRLKSLLMQVGEEGLPNNSRDMNETIPANLSRSIINAINREQLGSGMAPSARKRSGEFVS